MFKFYLLLAIALPLTHAVRLFLTNEAGWKHSHIRSLYNVLDNRTTNHELLLCAPANIRRPEWPLIPDTIIEEPENTMNPGFHGGTDPSNPRLNYVYDVGTYSAVKQGLKYRAPLVYKRRPGSDPEVTSPDTQKPWKADLILVGPNNGSILGSRGHFHGLHAVRILSREGHPVISFASAPSTHSKPYRRYEGMSKIYAKLANHIIKRVIESGKPPYLPKNTYLSVNFPDLRASNQKCTEVEDFTFVLTTHWKHKHYIFPSIHCHQLGFPYEETVVKSEGCYVAITLGDPTNPARSFSGRPSPSPLARHQIIKMLHPILGCFPKTKTTGEPE